MSSGFDPRRALVFGSVAELYDARRPGYPDALLDAVVGDGVERVLEAGAGTGRATLALARRGVHVEAVEPDAAMAAIASRACEGLDVTVRAGVRFEDWTGPAAFDRVVSAQAWHWVDPGAGAAVAARALRPGGAIALWWNRFAGPDAVAGDPAFAAVAEAYRREAPELADRTHVLNDRNDPVAVPAVYDGFGDWTPSSFAWTQTYSAQEFADLMATHSDHLLLDPDVRARLLDAITEAIDVSGAGVLDYPYRTDLHVAHRL
jgi:SAM-dependent methyltransferase